MNKVAHIKNALLILIPSILLTQCAANYTIIDTSISPSYDKEMLFELNKISIMSGNINDGSAVAIPIGVWLLRYHQVQTTPHGAFTRADKKLKSMI